MTRQPSGVMSNGGGPSGSTRAESPETISLGRPVEPPDVGAFHAGDTASSSGPSSMSALGRYPAGMQRRPEKAPSATPMTADGSASSTMAASSRPGSLADTGC